MGKIRISRGSAMVELSDELDRDIRQLLDDLVPGLATHIEEGVSRIAEEAIGKWPVKSGDSKAAFQYGVRLPSPDFIEGFITNTAVHSGKNYAYLIKGTDGKPIWRTWLVRPMDEYAGKLADDLAAQVARMLEEV